MGMDKWHVVALVVGLIIGLLLCCFQVYKWCPACTHSGTPTPTPTPTPSTPCANYDALVCDHLASSNGYEESGLAQTGDSCFDMAIAACNNITGGIRNYYLYDSCCCAWNCYNPSYA